MKKPGAFSYALSGHAKSASSLWSARILTVKGIAGAQILKYSHVCERSGKPKALIAVSSADRNTFHWIYYPQKRAFSVV